MLLEQCPFNILRNWWNADSEQLVKLKGYNITPQNLSFLCCEIYLNKEIVSMLITKYCNEANEQCGKDVFPLLTSFVRSNISTRAVHQMCISANFSTVEITFLPFHLLRCHWGLSIFDVKNREVRFDYGYHCPTTNQMQDSISSGNKPSTL